ncbi:MAG: AbrB/MazE/SpoVT family DNA-binding domain-containing protein [Motiliproteus sp.]|nr:AbrB/MazE/SpoVT family DNA-binding domain-containing protein [Motiliproteus sp.]MCW9053386.1 AbrB/MazE/SpoVT family DNA-binding domain-containing protein [Motiliproteus sp.]
MKMTIAENGVVSLDADALSTLGVAIGDEVDLYVRDGSIVIVKARARRGVWNEQYETVSVVDLSELTP